MNNIIRILKIFQSKNNKFYTFLVVQALIGGLSPLINIIFPKLIIDELIRDNNMIRLIELIALFAIGNLFTGILLPFINTRVEYNMDLLTEEVRFDLLEKANSLPLSKSESKSCQDMLEQAMYGYYSVKNLHELTRIVITSIVGSIPLGIILFRENIFFPIVMITMTLLTYPIIKKLKEIEEEFAKRSVPNDRVFKYFQLLSKDSRYLKDIKLYGANNFIVLKAKKYMDENLEINKKHLNEKGRLNGILDSLNQLQILFAFTFLVFELLSNRIYLGDFVLVFNAARQMQANLQNLIKVTNDMQTTEVLLRPLIEYLDIEIDDKEFVEDYSKLTNIKGHGFSLKFDNVCFSYPNTNIEVLRNLSFTINDKEKVAIVGRNGAGKSTIVKLMCRFYEPTRGDIYVNNINIKEIPKKEYYKIISATFQDFRLFPFRIIENIYHKYDEEISITERDKFYEGVNFLNLINWIDEQPERERTYITTMFSKKGILPSGGIAQKLALLRSILHEGEIIIIDEPSASLDPRSEEEIFRQMIDISNRKTTIFISHRLSSATYSDRILVVDKGQIVEEGSHDKLITEDGLYSKMFKKQAENYML